jgi:hypothetical protein
MSEVASRDAAAIIVTFVLLPLHRSTGGRAIAE